MNENKKFSIMLIIYLFMFAYVIISGRGDMKISIGGKSSINQRELLEVKNGIDKYKKNGNLTKEDEIIIEDLIERYNLINSEFNEYYSFPISKQLNNPSNKYSINRMSKQLFEDYHKFILRKK